ncbi:Activator of Hsp90 ATPase 1 family protein [Beutenbergia cavernae DSM 12333]|uniref:Activator of Hsp90 ATPase 1 family protein n=1 Tax=Beutenbergia cavernae (strain ATCC BAA-8 / DSM 12333 / CCUG 43141 / JCM 11478 / NBRC 16432 / NCIMB 13614 / HKI 0122) TaxID=471853 RepID=C5BWE9_BEUC1|nr:SRPBCC family protein [Beutenbergia cavernae]ACQ78607.1 Activator of Hsp90 ATPase 1 family protein [Beutenbergia cavernae DSM 12333]
MSITGTVTTSRSGRDLTLHRTFRAPIDDVWAAVTESERLDRWIGRYDGAASAGATVRFTMTAEDGDPEGDIRILACDAPRHLAVEMVDEHGTWNIELGLVESGGVTTLTFVQHLTPEVDVSSVGPGWEFYLDALVAAETGGETPSFDSYFPAMQEPYRRAAGV